MCKIKLTSVELSKINFYPGERLYIKCTFRALEDMPVNKEVRLFADFCFGHMFIDKKEETYYRTASAMYPQPAHWRKGETWSSCIVWNIPKDIWGGAYKIYIGIMDDKTIPMDFFVCQTPYLRHHVTDINIAFGGVAKKYMKNHSNKKLFSYESENIPSPSYNHNFDAVISVINLPISVS